METRRERDICGRKENEKKEIVEGDMKRRRENRRKEGDQKRVRVGKERETDKKGDG